MLFVRVVSSFFDFDLYNAGDLVGAIGAIGVSVSPMMVGRLVGDLVSCTTAGPLTDSVETFASRGDSGGREDSRISYTAYTHIILFYLFIYI